MQPPLPMVRIRSFVPPPSSNLPCARRVGPLDALGQSEKERAGFICTAHETSGQ